jgi:hypothetical protein
MCSVGYRGVDTDMVFFFSCVQIWWDEEHPKQKKPRKNKKHSLRVGWKEHVRVSLIFAIIVIFMLFTKIYFISKNL